MPRFDCERYRKFHRQRGVAYRWLKAFRVSDPRAVGGAERDGRLYVEQTVDPLWKALQGGTEFDYDDKEFGLVPKGSKTIAVMPDETYLSRLDRIIFPGEKKLTRTLLTRGSDAIESLVFSEVSSILSVRKDTTLYVAGTDYKLTGDTVEWLAGDAPDEGEKYNVEYLYAPTYIFLGEEKQPRLDKNGLLMPQRGDLFQYQPSE